MYVTVHIREPLKSFDKEQGIIQASGFLLWHYFHVCAERDAKQYSLTLPTLNDITKLFYKCHCRRAIKGECTGAAGERLKGNVRAL